MMVETRTFSGRTLDEALEAAARTYKRKHEDLQYRILEEKATLFGLDKRITIEVLEDKALPAIRRCLNRLFLDVPLALSYDIQGKGEDLHVELHGEDFGLLLKKNGALLDALQFLLIQIAQKHDFKGNILVDADNFREKLKRKLQRLARNLSKKAQREQRKIETEALPPHLRKIVHLEVAKTKGVTTSSIGNGYFKRIVIEPISKG